MTLEAKSPALSGQSAIDSGKKGGEFVHDVLHRITDRFIAGPLARKQVISADAEDFRQLQENINGAPALAALDLVHMLMADIQPESEFLLGKPHPVAFFLDPLSEFHLVEIHVSSFPQARQDGLPSPYEAVGTSGISPMQSKRKSAVEIESMVRGWLSLNQQIRLRTALGSFYSPGGILLRLLDLKSICVIQLLCISVILSCIHISGIVLPCLAMISSSVCGS